MAGLKTLRWRAIPEQAFAVMEWPLVLAVTWLSEPAAPLLAYLALIPLEDLLSLTDDEGKATTLAKAFGILFAVSYMSVSRAKLWVRLSSIPMPVVLYGLWAIFSYTWALDHDAAVSSLLTLVMMLVMVVLVIDFIRDRPHLLGPMFWAYSLAAAATALLGLYRFRTNAISTVYRAGAADTQDVAQFAAALLPAFLFFVHVFYTSHWGKKLLSAFASLVCVLGIAVSGTVSAMAGVAVALGFSYLPRIGWKRATAALIVTGAIVLAMLQFSKANAMLLQKFDMVTHNGGSGRSDIWRVGLTIFKQNALVGVGQGNFPVAFTDTAIHETKANFILPAELYHGRGTHNMYLAAGAELGIPGILLFLWVLWTAWGRRSDTSYGLLIQTMVLGYLIQGIFLDLQNRKYFWLIIALGIAINGRSRPVRAETPNAESPHPTADGQFYPTR
jgi:O-antigen ligase